VIRLYQFAPALGLPNASPFCMKVETCLRMMGLPYQAVSAMPMKAPKGKLPYIEDDGITVADSGMIFDYLRGKYGDRLDGRLLASDRAIALALRRLMEENLYWAVLYSRWFEPDGWRRTREAFFSALPAPARGIVPLLARRGIWKELYGHGMGRHTPEEIARIGCADLTALADFLGDKPYFLGAEPTSLDATAYAFIANVLLVPGDSALKRHAAGHANLGTYCARMNERFYPPR
jgi:glutathione S-transferase